MAGERTFTIRILADSKEALASLKRLGASSSKLGEDMDRGIGSVLKGLVPSFKTIAIAGTAAFGTLAAFTMKSVQAAITAQAEQNRLRQILLTTGGATEQQVDALFRQADALQQVGVVSAGNVSVVQAQLATFDLQATTIERLTPAILDYVTAEKGATASAEDFKSMTNGLAQALQGNFGSLSRTGFVLDDVTKKTIASGSETERAAALVGVLNSTYEGFNATLRDTTEGRLQVLRNGFEDIKTAVGEALLPVLDRLLDYFNDKIVPVILEDVIPGFEAFINTLGREGLGDAVAVGIAAMGDLGNKTIDALESMSISVLTFIRDIASLGEKLGMVATLVGGLTRNPAMAIKGAAIGMALGELETQIDKRLDSIGDDFDKLRGRVESARSKLAQFAKGAAFPELATDFRGAMGKMASGAGDVDNKVGGASKTVKTAKEIFKEYTDAMKAATKAQDSYGNSIKQTNRAQRSLTEAQTNLATAQEKFRQAVAGYGADSQQAKDAQRELDQAQRGVERSGYRVEEATFAIADAERELADVRNTPGATAQDVREAEIRLAEAKLALKDATDDQYESTKDLTQAQAILNEVVNGAIPGSETYEQLSRDVAEAEQRRADAHDAVTDAMKRQQEALDNLNEAIEKTQGFKGRAGFVSTIPNPVGPMTGAFTDAASALNRDYDALLGSSYGSPINITVNAGIGTSGVQVGQEINDYLSQYNRLNGGTFDRYGNIGIG